MHPDSTLRPWFVVQGLCTRTGEQKKHISEDCEALGLLLLGSVLIRQFVVGSCNLEINSPQMLYT